MDPPGSGSSEKAWQSARNWPVAQNPLCLQLNDLGKIPVNQRGSCLQPPPEAVKLGCTVKSEHASQDSVMVNKDDIRLVLAYFNLQSGRDYSPDEIAYRPTVRARFFKLAREIVGDRPAREIVLRLTSLKRSK
jgi:hypothetical protein